MLARAHSVPGGGKCWDPSRNLAIKYTPLGMYVSLHHPRVQKAFTTARFRHNVYRQHWPVSTSEVVRLC